MFDRLRGKRSRKYSSESLQSEGIDDHEHDRTKHKRTSSRTRNSRNSKKRHSGNILKSMGSSFKIKKKDKRSRSAQIGHNGRNGANKPENEAQVLNDGLITNHRHHHQMSIIIRVIMKNM